MIFSALPSAFLFDADLAPVGRGRLPLQVGQLLLAALANEPRLGPVGPVAAKAVAAIGDDEIELLRAGDVGVDLDRVARRRGRRRLGLAKTGFDVAAARAGAARTLLAARFASRLAASGGSLTCWRICSRLKFAGGG